MKKVWISMLSKDEEKAKKLMTSIGAYGLKTEGHFWSNNLEKMEWSAPRAPLLDKDTALWMIVASGDEFEDLDTRFGLSLLAISIQAARGHGFPIIFVHPDGKQPAIESLPTPLKHILFATDSSALGAKLVAKANTPFVPLKAGYRLDVYGLPGMGLWFEAGPVEHKWQGAMFGVSGGDINAHGVGQSGQLPASKMILNYPMEGLKLQLGEKEYTAWAVKNPFDGNNSYFTRVLDRPDSILFGEFSEKDDAEAFVVKMT